MRVAYLDCFSGVSGDMLLGALIDAGAAVATLSDELSSLPLDGWGLATEPVLRAGIAATRAVVNVSEPQPPRTLPDVVSLIEGSRLPGEDKERSAGVFRRMAEAEAAVHGETPESVHLHDAGAIDAIIDIVGTVVGLRLLGVDAIYCSPLPTGDGEARGPHGALPVPAPATLALLERANAPIRAGGRGELVTPTGAALVTTLAKFEQPPMAVTAVGYGAGSRDDPERPNVLRLWLGEISTAESAEMVLIETNIDDSTPEVLAYALEQLLALGAADAWLTPVTMKKGRPGVVLSILCRQPDEEAMVRLVLRETSTLGVRARPVRRWEAGREVVEFQSSLGPARVKVKRLPGDAPVIAPEYEVCRELAAASGLPLQEVYRMVQAEAAAHIS
jgi:hypothetical protein